jgi:hypothetical protein
MSGSAKKQLNIPQTKAEHVIQPYSMAGRRGVGPVYLRGPNLLSNHGADMHLLIPRAPACCLALLLLVAVAHADPTGEQATPAWPDNFRSCLEALALLETLDADLLSHNSATLTLYGSCDAHHLAPHSRARIVADRVRGADEDLTAQQHHLLQVNATEPVRYRRVRLVCGS